MLSFDERLPNAQHYSAEVEVGNVEYKYKLVNLTAAQIQHRTTQLNWRLNEGNDEAYYKIGVRDDGYPIGLSDENLKASLETLKKMALLLNCNLTIQSLLNGEVGKIAFVHFKRKECELTLPEEVFVAVIGDTNSGKTTLISILFECLKNIEYDNGHGSCRNKILRHEYEIANGYTSSKSYYSLLYDNNGEVLNHRRAYIDYSQTFEDENSNTTNRRRVNSNDEVILSKCKRAITLVDYPGREKYKKTVIQGLVQNRPNLCIITISALNRLEGDLPKSVKENIGFAVALHLKIVIVITKIDGLSNAEHSLLNELVTNMLEACGYEMLLITDPTRLDMSLKYNNEDNKWKIPIFHVSNVTGSGILLLHKYLFLANGQKSNERETYLLSDSLLMKRINLLRLNENCEANSKSSKSSMTSIESVSEKSAGTSSISFDNYCYPFSVEVFGYVQSDEIRIGDKLQIGPDAKGTYKNLVVTAIHIHDVSVSAVNYGKSAYFSLCSIVSEIVESKEVSIDESSIMLSNDIDKQNDGCPKQMSRLEEHEILRMPIEYDSRRRKRITSTDIEEAIAVSKSEISNKIREMQFRRLFRSGIALRCPNNIPRYPSSQFEAKIFILNHYNGIHVNYEPVICGNGLRQCAKLISFRKLGSRRSSTDMNSELLFNGDTAICKFKFKINSEHLEVGSTIVIREGCLVGIGNITSIFE